IPSERELDVASDEWSTQLGSARLLSGHCDGASGCGRRLSEIAIADFRDGDDHRSVGSDCLLQLAAQTRDVRVDGAAVEIQIEEDQVRLLGVKHPHGFFAIGSLHRVVVLQAKVDLQPLPESCLVFDDENPGHAYLLTMPAALPPRATPVRRPAPTMCRAGRAGGMSNPLRVSNPPPPARRAKRRSDEPRSSPARPRAASECRRIVHDNTVRKYVTNLPRGFRSPYLSPRESQPYPFDEGPTSETSNPRSISQRCR